jgi:hypothetical protein
MLAQGNTEGHGKFVHILIRVPISDRSGGNIGE